LIYLDASVALAHLFSEDRCPPPSLWDERLISSRLFEYELWTRIHARGLTQTHPVSEAASLLINRVSLVEMAPLVLFRALNPFPSPVRTLDALHLASADFLRSRIGPILIASYDDRLLSVARQMDFTIAEV
jgi:hypothetical protein